ncbi:putative dna repair protein rad26 [Diplodia seriata]|uniref:Putative dna repair protein rad26 n=1 Tax=Diplodia seriata TaxID=420778 RepID=A0A0G2GHT1_9PEZI|nr:putative dna repair protein rad26 [Diplodia seriata]
MAVDDDEFGSADDLDTIPSDELRELETQALASTQHRRNSNAPPDPATPSQQAQAPPPPDPPQPEYEFPDADTIHLDGQPLLAQLPKDSATGPLQRFGGNPAVTATTRRTAQDLANDQRESLYEHGLNRHARNSNYNLGGTAATSVPPPHSAEDLTNAGEEELKAKIDELQRAIEDVKKSKQEAEAQAQRRAGEAAILRGKYERADKEKVAKLASMRTACTEKVTSLEAQIEGLKREIEKLKTQYQFQEVELRAEAGKLKSRRNLKDGAANSKTGKPQATTPKKNRIAEYGDGFDDGGVMEISPSKSREKSRNGTPRQGAKRKRNAMETSPAKPLPLSEPQQPQVPEDESIVMPDAEQHDDILATVSKSDGKFKESYYKPLHVILDTLQFVLSFESLEKTASLAEEIVPLAQSSASLVVWTSLDNPELKQHIDLHECLCLMLTVSRSCVYDVGATTRFWSLVSHDFIRALFKTPFLSTLSLTVQLLATSVTPTTFGPIPEELPVYSANPNKEVTALDYLVAFLQEAPPVVPSQPALWSFRLTLLHAFSAFLPSPAAAAALATHRCFVGRLFILLNDAVATLYATAPRTPLAATLAHVANLGIRVAFVLLTEPATRALVDRHERVAAVQGATHAHLVGLTRLAFVDVDADADVIDDGDDGGPAAAGGFGGARVLEAGIEEEVVDMAHQLLDEFLSPAEGEELVKVFSTARTAS